MVQAGLSSVQVAMVERRSCGPWVKGVLMNPKKMVTLPLQINSAPKWRGPWGEPSADEPSDRESTLWLGSAGGNATAVPMVTTRGRHNGMKNMKEK
ncbi:hypothetical protein EYF80_026440 [Liparis tanakae]|uniref:Uncharacterized protein n=1 Tax=Liparis tanakae TaxID=230148 RepID=A0A4Z2HBU9_9TELE|nr:hypothetical protein EYF80_026440 [Liparis tanakae]